MDKQLWAPSSNFVQSSNMYAYMQWLNNQYHFSFDNYNDLCQWSVDEPEKFWESIWHYYKIQSPSEFKRVIKKPDAGMIGTQWFEGAKVNYAAHVFRNQTPDCPAVLFQSERHGLTEISWDELENKVSKVASFLKSKNVGQGDRVVCFMPNIPEALIAFLATNSIGAVWSSCSPDFGTPSVIDRFQQIDPKVLFTVDGYTYNGKPFSKINANEELLNALTTVEQVVMLPYLDTASKPLQGEKHVLWDDVVQMEAGPLEFTPIPFNDPIWVLYSSGTTGKPKAITHSVGGILIEHLKAMGLHQNCKPGDRFFWYSTTGWMMWNYANAALLLGGTVVIYDGAATYPKKDVLWELAEKTKITHFGGGAAYYTYCMNEKMKPGESFDLEHLQSIGSTGSPLPPEAFEWIYREVKENLWLISLSGGTDVCSGFVGGSPFLPVYSGEIQCRMLGCKLEAFNENGEFVTDEVGEMVITGPMPSMPVYFWNDKGNQRYHDSYFAMYPDIWRHGDWVKITDRGSLVIFGRSDATLNRGGVRIGTSEVYSAVESLEEVQDSLVISLELEGGRFFMPLFVVLNPGFVLNDELKNKIKQSLRTKYSPRHVPDEIFQINEVPMTISGKKMETPVKKILMGIPDEKAITKDAMRNPGSVAYFVEFYKRKLRN
jgi:acetoacetyl-CoA synthetase